MKKRFLSCLLAMAILLPFLPGCATNPVTGKQELSLVGDNKANDIGRKAYPQIRQNWGGDYNDQELAEYVSSIGKSLAQVSHSPELPFEFKVTNSSTVNAITLPGGKIFITRGMLTEMKNESQLAAVLGHEIGHATARHGQKGMSWNMAMQGTILLATIAVQTSSKSDRDARIASGVIQAGIIGANIVRAGYSRDQELQADELGVDYMMKAGYHPDGAIQLQEILASKEKKRPSFFEELMRSHPVSDERVKHVKGYVYTHEAGSGVLRKGDGFFAKRYEEKTAKMMVVSKAFKHHDKAKRHLRKKEAGLARDELEKAIEIAPDQADFYILKGDMALKRKDYAEAKRLYEKAKKLAPGYYKPHARLGSLAKITGKNEDALKNHKKAMTLNPGYGKSYIESGLVYFEKKEYKNAAQLLNAGTSIDPRQGGNTYTALGYSYEKLGMSPNAHTAYINAVRHAPDADATDFAKKRIDYLNRYILKPRR